MTKEEILRFIELHHHYHGKDSVPYVKYYTKNYACSNCEHLHTAHQKAEEALINPLVPHSPCQMQECTGVFRAQMEMDTL